VDVAFDSRPRAKGLGVLHHFPIFRQFFHFQKVPQVPSFQAHYSPVKTVFCQNAKKRPKIAKPTKHEPLPKRDANFLKFPEERDLRTRPTTQKVHFALP